MTQAGSLCRCCNSWRRLEDLAALVPVEDHTLLEELEDRLDYEAAEEALAEMRAKGEKPIPWEQVKAELGLE